MYLFIYLFMYLIIFSAIIYLFIYTYVVFGPSHTVPWFQLNESKSFWGGIFFQATEPWLVHSSLTLYPTGRSWQSCVHPLTRRFKHSFTLQFLSSDRSPQSSLPSQRFLSEMQRPLEHMKKEPLHKLPEKSKTRPQLPVISQQSWGMLLTWQWILTD